MDQAKYEAALIDFLASGKGFFSWFQGKNTPNILFQMSRQLGAIELALKQTDRKPTIKEFAYLSGGDLGELWAKVQRHLSEGWQPYQTLVVGVVDGKTQFFQAVARYEEPASQNALQNEKG